MRNRKPGMFKYRSNGRSNNRNFRRQGGGQNLRLIPRHYSNGQGKSNFKPHQSAEKLLERYKILAKEALSSGDRTLNENYLQHIDHFERVISNKNSNQNTSQTTSTTQEKVQDSNLPQKKEINQDPLSEDKK